MAQAGRTTTLGVRARLLGRLLAFAVGLGGIGLGVFNLFLAPLSGFEAIAPYRVFGLALAENGGYYLGDVFVIAAGLIVVYLASR